MRAPNNKRTRTLNMDVGGPSPARNYLDNPFRPYQIASLRTWIAIRIRNQVLARFLLTLPDRVRIFILYWLSI